MSAPCIVNCPLVGVSVSVSVTISIIITIGINIGVSGSVSFSVSAPGEGARPHCHPTGTWVARDPGTRSPYWEGQTVGVTGSLFFISFFSWGMHFYSICVLLINHIAELYSNFL